MAEALTRGKILPVARYWRLAGTAQAKGNVDIFAADHPELSGCYSILALIAVQLQTAM